MLSLEHLNCCDARVTLMQSHVRSGFFGANRLV